MPIVKKREESELMRADLTEGRVDNEKESHRYSKHFICIEFMMVVE